MLVCRRQWLILRLLPSIDSSPRVSRPEQPFRQSIMLCLSSSSTAWLASTLIDSHLIPDSHHTSLVCPGQSSPYRSKKLLSYFRYHTLYSSTPLRSCRSFIVPGRGIRQTDIHLAPTLLEPPYNTLNHHSSTCADAAFPASEVLHITNETPLYAPTAGLRHHPPVTRNHFNPYQVRSSIA